jgi:excisionase family DNA binding protein
MSGGYLTVQAAATLTVFSPRSLRDPRFRARHGLRAVRIGNRLRFRRDELEAWLEANREDHGHAEAIAR